MSCASESIWDQIDRIPRLPQPMLMSQKTARSLGLIGEFFGAATPLKTSKRWRRRNKFRPPHSVERDLKNHEVQL
jgi:hypothetical protein